jgi:hypothetical protein
LSRERKKGTPPSPACGRGTGGEGAPLPRLPRQPARESSGVVRPLRAVAAKGSEAGRQINRVAPKPALGQENRDLARRPRVAGARRINDHARKPRGQREARDRAADIRNASLAVDRADGGQQRARFSERAARRRIEEGEARRIGDAPDRAVEQEA